MLINFFRIFLKKSQRLIQFLEMQKREPVMINFSMAIQLEEIFLIKRLTSIGKTAGLRRGINLPWRDSKIR